MDEEIGMRIARCRGARGWKLEDLARRVGLSRSIVCRIERGRRTLTTAELALFARVLAAPVEWLMEGRGPAPRVDGGP